VPPGRHPVFYLAQAVTEAPEARERIDAGGEVTRSNHIPKKKGNHMAKVSLQLRLPIQAEPVNRFKILKPFELIYPAIGPDGQPVIGSDGQPIKVHVISNVSPIRNTYSPFSSEVDQRLGICPVLSAYAVARCFQAGGLF
jgi:hypothetical protein